MQGRRDGLTPHALGAMGEARTEQYLAGMGWRILDHNFRAYDAEIDLIADDGTAIVFIEVKVRNHARMAAREAVTLAKQRRISRCALYYMKRNGLLGRQARFDVVEIQDGHLTHLRNAFPYQGPTF